MGGASFLLLSSLVVVTVQAQGCTRPVGTDMILKDEYILLTDFPDGVTVAFSCEIGHETAGGSGKITCTNGTWSRLTLRCQKKTCGAAGEVENGVIDYNKGNQFGDIATVTCNEGYDLIGNRELICGDQGWLNRPPVCEVVKCDAPSKIINGTFNPVKDSYAYGEVVKYSCIADHTVNGPESLTCSDDGTFKPNPPKCPRVECPEPDIDNAKWKDGSRPPYRYKSSVTYECEKGFTLQGVDTITCDINSRWSPGRPKCIPAKEVTTKATTTTTTTTTAPMDENQGTSTPDDPSDGGENNSDWRYTAGCVAGAGAAAAAGAAGGVAYNRNKKRKRKVDQDKKSTNDEETELCSPNNAAAADVKDNGTADVKDDVTQQHLMTNSCPVRVDITDEKAQ